MKFQFQFTTANKALWWYCEKLWSEIFYLPSRYFEAPLQGIEYAVFPEAMDPRFEARWSPFR